MKKFLKSLVALFSFVAVAQAEIKQPIWNSHIYQNVICVSRDADSDNCIIEADTTDGSDNKSFIIAAGGGSTSIRGAVIIARGNEVVATPGYIHLTLGNVASSQLLITGAQATSTIRLSMAGLTASRPLKIDSNKDIVAEQIDLASTSDVTGILPVANGGTGASAVGSSNQVLGVNNAGTALEYKTVAVGTSGTDFAVANAVNSITLNLPDAGAAARGVITTGAQTLAGQKTLSSAPILSSLTASRPLKLDGSKIITATQIDLTSTNDITGALLVANGGTGLASYTAGDLITATGTTTLASLAKGTANQILGMNSGATTQEYKTVAVGTSGTDFAVANAANSLTFNLPDASATNRGAVTTGAQTIAGDKTLSGTTNLSALSASLPLSLDGSKNIVSAALDLTSATQFTAVWSDWVPTLGASGAMTYTSTTISYAKYMQIGKAVWLIIDVTGTTGGTPDTGLTFTLPVTAATSSRPKGISFVADGGAKAGSFNVSSTTVCTVYTDPTTTANWGAGASRRYVIEFFYVAA